MAESPGESWQNGLTQPHHNVCH